MTVDAAGTGPAATADPPAPDNVMGDGPAAEVWVDLVPDMATGSGMDIETTSSASDRLSDSGATDAQGVADTDAVGNVQVETGPEVPSAGAELSNETALPDTESEVALELPPVCKPTLPAVEACDLVDNDCDGQTDEDPCDDGNACTGTDTCTGGLCAGTPKWCDDDNTCTTDSCKNGGCASVALANGTACDDDLACTTDDTCKGVKCIGLPIQLTEVSFGGDKEDRFGAMVQLADGGYALAGQTASSGAGAADGWLVRIDGKGKALWSQTYGGKLDDRVFAVVATPDGFTLAGLTVAGNGDSDAWLVHSDNTGKLLWQNTYGGNQFDAAYGLVAATDGGYALAGTTASSGKGGTDAWMLRTDSTGKQLWSKTYGWGGNDSAYALAAVFPKSLVMATDVQFTNGKFGIAVIGSSETDTTPLNFMFDVGNPAWDPGPFKQVVASAIHRDPWDYTYLLAGSVHGTVSSQALVGIGSWTTTYCDGIDTGCEAFDIAALPDGTLVLVGWLSGPDKNKQAWLMRTDKDFKQAAQQTFGGAFEDSARALRVTPGAFALAGVRSKSMADTDGWWALVPYCQ